MDEVVYKCIKCGTIATEEEWTRTKRFRCPYCTYRIAKKVRPPKVKHVKAR